MAFRWGRRALSTLVAEVFMAHMEEELLPTDSNELVYYARYIDDIIGIWNGPDSDLQQFLDKMNHFHTSMEFTLEIGGDSLNFLAFNSLLAPLV